MLTPSVSNILIDLYKNNPSLCKLWYSSNTLNLAQVENQHDDLGKKVTFAMSSYLNKCGIQAFPELVQVIHRPPSSLHNLHVDDARDTTVMTSITYLNDNYEGGETFFEDGLSVTPKLGRTLFFDGKKYAHGVNEVKNGHRFVLAIWYSSSIHDLYGIN